MGKKRKHQDDQPLPPAGSSVHPWCRAAGIGKATYYTIPEDSRPLSVKIGKRRIIIEAPGDWLRRMAARGGVEISNRAAV